MKCLANRPAVASMTLLVAASLAVGGCGSTGNSPAAGCLLSPSSPPRRGPRRAGRSRGQPAEHPPARSRGSSRCPDRCRDPGDGARHRPATSARRRCAARARRLKRSTPGRLPGARGAGRGRGDLVMERLHGRDMLADLARRPWRTARHARVLQISGMPGSGRPMPGSGRRLRVSAETPGQARSAGT